MYFPRSFLALGVGGEVLQPTPMAVTMNIALCVDDGLTDYFIIFIALLRSSYMAVLWNAVSIKVF